MPTRPDFVRAAPALTRASGIRLPSASTDLLRQADGGLFHPTRSHHASWRTKSQIQALDRTQPSLPMKKGRAGTMTHDYKRNGLVTLFAALNVASGMVTHRVVARHRHEEFLGFLKQIQRETPKHLDLHLIVDNYRTHKHPTVVAWLGKHPRFHLHFVPTSSSWLNLVERFFAEITRKRIRRDSFRNVNELTNAINDYIAHNNQNPKPFVWTAKADAILKKVTRCRVTLEALH